MCNGCAFLAGVESIIDFITHLHTGSTFDLCKYLYINVRSFLTSPVVTALYVAILSCYI